MKTKIKYLLILVLASFAFVGCCTMHSKAKQWEYKTARLAPDSTQFDQQLNDAVNGGWRVISVTPEPNGYAYYILERPKH